MADFNQRPQRQTYDVSNLNITCAECGVKIESLPFEPTKKEDGTYGRIYCRDCNSKRRQSSGGFQRRDRY